MPGNRHTSSFSIIVSCLCVALVGLVLIPLLPIKLAPSSTLPGLSVQFSMPGNSSRIVEMEATSKFESMLTRIQGVRNIYSTSGNGWGNVTLEFDKHTSIDVARFEASAIVRQTWHELSGEVSYPQIIVQYPDRKSSRPFMTFSINSAATLVSIKKYTENIIKQKLSHINGLYKIEVGGATPMEWQLTYDNNQLEAVGITIDDIREAISRYYASDFLGMVDTDMNNGQHSWMRILLSPERKSNTFDASAITIKSKNGTLFHLDRLIEVKHVEQPPTGYYRINGLNSIFLELTADVNANQLRLSKEVHKVIEKIRCEMPPGYEILNSYDASEYIKSELNKIYLRSGLTILMLLLFVFLITRNIRYLFLIFVTLAINLFIAVIFYYLFGLELQLYSLAGITISLSLLIDNTIIMTDHLLRRGNRKAFMPILAATMTTAGALCIIFLLPEKVRVYLQDFAAIVMINLCVSLLMALFFVPALAERIRLKEHPSNRKFSFFFSTRFLRITIHFTHLYARIIHLLNRRKWIPFATIILIFGLPVFLIPDRIEKEIPYAKWHNRIFDSPLYKENVKPIVNTILGGTSRLFAEKVYRDSYLTRDEDIILTIAASMPNGTTLSQMNAVMENMEHYLNKFPEIKLFQTDIPNSRQASIRIFFTKTAEADGFPYRLQKSVINKAMELGGGSWSVYGLEDLGFNNNVGEQAGIYSVKLYGYNYDELKMWADTLKNRLLTHRRIKDVNINSSFSWYKDDYHEYFFDLNKQKAAAKNISPQGLFTSLQSIFAKDNRIGTILVNGNLEYIKLTSRESKDYDIWALKHSSNPIENRFYRLEELADITKMEASPEIEKENQQYRLVVQFDYIGASKQAYRLLSEEIERINKLLPMGYSAHTDFDMYQMNKSNKTQYWLIGLLIVIIFFTTSILFNSIKQPFAVIFIIPVSFIGIFLTFYGFKLNFDQGGFASFILLSGITVNAAIYILNEYNSIRKNRPNLGSIDAYLKAWNSKIIPILLTIGSTILGFLPFMIGSQKEAFWFPLAAGTIGGLVMSVVGIFIFLPLFLIRNKKRTI